MESNICGISKVAVSRLDYLVSEDQTPGHKDLTRVWKEDVVVNFQEICNSLPGESE